MQYYDVDGTKFKHFKNTVTIENGLKFPEFMVLLLKAISYLQMNLQDNDTDIYTFFKQKIQKIIKIGYTIFLTKL